VRCKSCGLIFTNPRPNAKDLIRYYQENYSPYKFSIPKQFLPRKPDGSAPWKTRAKEIILHECYGYPVSPDTSTFWKGFGLLLRILTHRLAFFPRYVQGGRLLEVGCSTGHYLHLVHELGWTVKGIEFHPESSCFARETLGLDVFTGELLDAQLPESSFDAVILFHVLEHLPNPMEVLYELYRLLKPGGSLYIAVPNINAFEARVFGSYYGGLEVPRHLYHFSPKTLSQMLEKVGFTVHQTRFDLFNNSLDVALSVKNRAQKKGWKLVNHLLNEKGMSILRALYAPIGIMLAACGFGTRFIISAKKIANFQTFSDTHNARK
jgi:SAM-dependent methyltransferase